MVTEVTIKVDIKLLKEQRDSVLIAIQLAESYDLHPEKLAHLDEVVGLLDAMLDLGETGKEL